MVYKEIKLPTIKQPEVTNKFLKTLINPVIIIKHSPRIEIGGRHLFTTKLKQFGHHEHIKISLLSNF